MCLIDVSIPTGWDPQPTTAFDVQSAPEMSDELLPLEGNNEDITPALDACRAIEAMLTSLQNHLQV